MQWPDKPPSSFPDARKHALVMLEAVDGDYQMILDNIETLVAQYGLEYALRLEACIRPKGEA